MESIITAIQELFSQWTGTDSASIEKITPKRQR